MADQERWLECRFSRVLDGEDVTTLVTVDPIDHGRRVVLCRTIGPVTSTVPWALRPDPSKHQEVAVLQG